MQLITVTRKKSNLIPFFAKQIFAGLEQSNICNAQLTIRPWFFGILWPTDGGTSSWTANVNLDIDIFVISEPKLLKKNLQAHFFKVFGHTKFQLSITSTLKVIKLLVNVTKYLH